LPSAEQILAKLERLSGHQNVGAAWEQLARFRQGNEALLEVTVPFLVISRNTNHTLTQQYP
jgi:hypothetical protein